MLKRVLHVFACIGIVLLTACANQPGAITSAVAPTPVAATAGVPAPASNSVGVVSGTLIAIRKSGSKDPLAKAPLYLGSVMKSDAGVEGLVRLNRDIAPKTSVDPQGNFAFSNVPPGRYGLMLDTPRGTLLLSNPADATKDMIIEIKGGDSVVLGRLEYPFDVPFDK